MIKPTVKPVSDAVLDCFYPLALLARCFGYFPFSNLGSWSLRASDLRPLRLRFDVILALFAMLTMTYSCVTYVHKRPHRYGDNFNDYVHIVYQITYRFSAQIIFLYFSVIRNKDIILFVRRVCLIEGASVTARRKAVYRNSVMLTFSVLIFCTTYGVYMHYFLNFDNILDHIISVAGAIYVIFTFSFTAAFVVYFCFCLTCQFDDVAKDLRRLILSTYVVHNFSAQLAHIRHRHEHLVTLVDDLNDILSPSLFFFVISHTLGSCMNFFGLCQYLFVEYETRWDITSTCVFGLNRALPLIAVCLASERLAKKIESGAKYVNRCEFTGLTRQSEFQIHMLVHQLERRKTFVSVGTIFQLHNRFLIEVAGVILTYTIIMMEINGAENASAHHPSNCTSPPS